MSFTSFPFLFLFLPLLLAAYYLTGRRFDGRVPRAVLLAASIGFYALFGLYALALLCLLAAASYLLNRSLLRAARGRGLILAAGVLLNLAPLLLFKYAQFFCSEILRLDRVVSFGILMPVGISFYTFKQLAFLIDGYRKKNTEYRFVEYAQYVFFFPQITSGPIEIHDRFVEQLRDPRLCVADADRLSEGFARFTLGFAKKLLIADRLAGLAAVCFAPREEANSTMALMAMFAFSLQIYFDFSGYSDMAIGIGKLLGFETIENFDSPYRARTVGEFWKRWHISLTGFFTKYVYIPLGGNRKGLARTCLNILIVFLLSGFWHGANWTFLFWGLVYGLLLVLERVVGLKAERVPTLLGRTLTFLIVSALWVFFRADSMSAALALFREMFAFRIHALSTPAVDALSIPPVKWILEQLPAKWWLEQIWPLGFVGAAFLLTQLPLNSIAICREKRFLSRPWAYYLVILFYITIMSVSKTTSFIYWDF